MELIVRITFDAEDEDDRIEEVDIAVLEGYQITRIDYPLDQPRTAIFYLEKSEDRICQ